MKNVLIFSLDDFQFAYFNQQSIKTRFHKKKKIAINSIYFYCCISNPYIFLSFDLEK